MIRRYWPSAWFKTGFALFVLGTGPFLLILLAATLGLTRDPNPNPVGPGILMFLTFWPSVILMGIGVLRVRRAERGTRG